MALGIPSKQFTPELTLYLGRIKRRRELPFDEAGLRARMEVGPAPTQMVALQLSNLFYSVGRELEGDRELNEAQALGPNEPFIKEALARREVQNRRPEKAVALYREAIAQGTLNPRAFLISATDWLDQTRSGGSDRVGMGGIFAGKALPDIRQALRLNPGNPAAYRVLGRALYLHPEISPEHVEELGAGVGPGDEAGFVRYYRSLLFARLNRPTEAQTDLRALVESSSTAPEVRRQAEQRLSEMAFNETLDRANDLVARGQFAEARAWVASRQTTAEARALPEPHNKLLRRIQDLEQRTKPAP